MHSIPARPLRLLLGILIVIFAWLSTTLANETPGGLSQQQHGASSLLMLTSSSQVVSPHAGTTPNMSRAAETMPNVSVKMMSFKVYVRPLLEVWSSILILAGRFPVHLFSMSECTLRIRPSLSHEYLLAIHDNNVQCSASTPPPARTQKTKRGRC